MFQCYTSIEALFSKKVFKRLPHRLFWVVSKDVVVDAAAVETMDVVPSSWLVHFSML